MDALSKYKVNEYQLLGGGPYDSKSHRLRRMVQRTGPDKWALYVQYDSVVLNCDGEAQWEPSPSGRDDEYLARCRFESPEAALAVYNAWLSKQASVTIELREA